jgi:hypothetical protein
MVEQTNDQVLRLHSLKAAVINCRTVEQPSHPPTPPSCSECATKTQAAGGSPPTQSASRMWRSSNGNMRIDTPHSSIISNPAGQQTIMLDHLKKEATVIPTPPASSAPSPSGSPQMPGATAPHPPLQVQDLGKSVIEGHEVEGKRYILTPPQAPQTSQPAPPQPPPMPKMPKLPQSAAPKPPQLPKPPQPTVTEVWTSVKLKTSVLTKVTTSAGEQTTYCKPTSTEEPHPALFEIPPGYKLKKPSGHL